MSDWHKAYQKLCNITTQGIDDIIAHIIENKRAGRVSLADKVLTDLFAVRHAINRHHTDTLTNNSESPAEEQTAEGQTIEGQTIEDRDQNETETAKHEEGGCQYHQPPHQQAETNMPPQTPRANFLFLNPPLEETLLKTLNKQHEGKSVDALPETLMHIVVVAQTKSVKLPVFPQGKIHEALHYRATLPPNTFSPNTEITEAMLIVQWNRKAIWRTQRVAGNLNMLMEWTIGSDGVIRD